MVLIYYNSANYNILTNNTVTENNYGFHFFIGCNYNVFTNNTAINSSNSGFYFYDGLNNSIDSNSATNSSQYGFYLGSGLNNTYTANTAILGLSGFRIWSSSNNSFIDNIATNSSEHGTYLYTNSNYNVFTNHTASNSSWNGFYFETSSNNTITNSYIHSLSVSSSNAAIKLASTSTNNTFTNNTVNSSSSTSNVSKSIHLSLSYNNTFTNNTLLVSSSDSTAAIFTSLSSDNTFLQNNITSSIWVDDSNGLNYYNDSDSGNIYYFANGTASWDVYNVTDLDSNYWSDSGSDRPFNSTISQWENNGIDYYPYTANIVHQLTLNSPVNSIYESDNVTLNYSSHGASTCWYTIDGGVSVSLAGCTNITLTNLSTDAHVIRLIFK